MRYWKCALTWGGYASAAATAALIAFAPAGDAEAQSTSTDFDVTASVGDNCTITATALSFGSYDPVVTNSASGSDLEVTSTVTVNCTSGASVTIELDDGLQPDTGASPTQRRMVGALATPDHLNYEIYQDSGRTARWGTTAETAAVSTTGTGADEEHTAYGRVPKDQQVQADSYSDTITATVSF